VRSSRENGGVGSVRAPTEPKEHAEVVKLTETAAFVSVTDGIVTHSRAVFRGAVDCGAMSLRPTLPPCNAWYGQRPNNSHRDLSLNTINAIQRMAKEAHGCTLQ
jgi:hypothetical protein